MIKTGIRLLGFLVMLLNGEVALASSPATAFPSFADLVDELMPSVVNISTTTKTAENAEDNLLNDEANSEFLQYFENGKKQEALGSGFIIDKEGYIITNNHVISDAEKINVTLSDNTQVEAEIIGRDSKTDIALIKIKPLKELTPVKFGDSDKVRVGDWILAIGNPFGLGGSVTAGIISAKSRDIESGQYDNFIQTDASINQGSSGGPMFNMQGEVIGINSVIFSTNGASMGIGFAIPINLADWVISQLKQFGETRRGWIGIKIQPNTQETAQELGLSPLDGVLVSDVTVGGPAQKAGIAAGDIILSFDGQEINNTKNFSRMVAETPIGKRTVITIWRNKQKQVLNISIDQLPPENDAGKISEKTEITQISDNEYLINELDLKVAALTPENTAKQGLPPDIKGMLITEVISGSDAAAKGLKAGNVIVKIDKKDAADIEAVKTYINEAKMENNRPVLLLVQDKDAVHFAALKLKAKEK